MSDDMSSFKEFMDALCGPMILAAFGGIARACRYGVKSWRQFCGSIVVSAFTGVVVHLMLQETSFSTSLQAAIVAASGYSGGAILDAIATGIIHQIREINACDGCLTAGKARLQPSRGKDSDESLQSISSMKCSNKWPSNEKQGENDVQKKR